jgi:hypothetical protein
MKERIEQRMKALCAEYRAGEEILADLANRQSNLKLTLTRISGAIQVLEELLRENSADAPAGGGHPDAKAAA